MDTSNPIEDSEEDNVCSICSEHFNPINIFRCGETRGKFQNSIEKILKYFPSDIWEHYFHRNFEKDKKCTMCANCLLPLENIFKVNEELEKLHRILQELIITFTNEVSIRRQNSHKEEISTANPISPNIAREEFPPEEIIEFEAFYHDNDEELKYTSPLERVDGSSCSENEDTLDSGEDGDFINSDDLNVPNDKDLFQAAIQNFGASSSPSYRNLLASMKPFSIVLTKLASKSVENGNVKLPVITPRRKRNAAIVALKKIRKIDTAIKEDIHKSIKNDRDGDWTSNSSSNGDVETDSEPHDFSGDVAQQREGNPKNNEIRCYLKVSKRFKCQELSCGYEFNFKRQLTKHEANSGHVNYKKRNCTQCSKRFFRKKDLKVHFDNIHKTFNCRKCTKKFKRKELLNCHFYHCHLVKSFTCEDCDCSFRRKVLLQQHTKMHGSTVFACRICSQVFRWRALLKLHIEEIHEGKTCSICKICQKAFKNKHLLSRHQMMTHRRERVGIWKLFPCIACKKTHFVERIWNKCIIKHFRRGQSKGFACAICANRFKTAAKLVEHSIETNHRNIKSFKCRSCGICFLRSADLIYHRKTHVTPVEDKIGYSQEFRCRICCTIYKSKSALCIHEKIHIKSNRYECDSCGKQYSSNRKKLFIAHVNTHRDKTFFEGTISKRSTQFHNDKTFQGHSKYGTENSNSETLSFECVACWSNFVSEEKLKIHYKTHRGTKLTCKVCGKPQPDLQAIRSHLKTHSAKFFPCGKCDLSFNTSKRLSNHEMSVHSTEDGPFVCQLCNKTFKTEFRLYAHSRLHKREKSLCNICGKTFASKHYLRLHRTKVHFKIFSFPCNTCDKKFCSASLLSDHIVRTHKPKKYVCDVCEKRYATQYPLKVHQRSHTGERPYACQKCDKKFTLQGQLNLHVEAAHSGKSILCELCKKTFTSKSGLYIHMRTVHGGKVFQCEICSYTCKRNDNLVTHLRSHTKEKPFVCDTCGKTFTRKDNLSTHLKWHEKVKDKECISDAGEDSDSTDSE